MRIVHRLLQRGTGNNRELSEKFAALAPLAAPSHNIQAADDKKEQPGLQPSRADPMADPLMRLNRATVRSDDAMFPIQGATLWSALSNQRHWRGRGMSRCPGPLRESQRGHVPIHAWSCTRACRARANPCQRSACRSSCPAHPSTALPRPVSACSDPLRSAPREWPMRSISTL